MFFPFPEVFVYPKTWSFITISMSFLQVFLKSYRCWKILILTVEHVSAFTEKNDAVFRWALAICIFNRQYVTQEQNQNASACGSNGSAKNAQSLKSSVQNPIQNGRFNYWPLFKSINPIFLLCSYSIRKSWNPPAEFYSRIFINHVLRKITSSVFMFSKKRRRQNNVTPNFSKTVICYEMSSAAQALRKYRGRKGWKKYGRRGKSNYAI